MIEGIQTSLSKKLNLFCHLPCRMKTQTVIHGIVVVSHRSAHTGTGKRHHVPDALFLITLEKVGQVEHHLLIGYPILVTVALIGILVPVGIHLLSPESLNLSTKTDTWRKPLTESQGDARIAAELLERTLRQIVSSLFGRIPCIPVQTSLHKPITAKRIGGNTIFFFRNYVLSKTSHKNTSQSQQSKYLFHTYLFLTFSLTTPYYI